MKYKIPTRGLLGLRNSILTVTRGTAVLNTIFDEYGSWAGDISTRDLGSLVISNPHYLFVIFLHEITLSLFAKHPKETTVTSPRPSSSLRLLLRMERVHPTLLQVHKTEARCSLDPELMCTKVR